MCARCTVLQYARNGPGTFDACSGDQVTVIAARKLHPLQGAPSHHLIPLYTLGHLNHSAWHNLDIAGLRKGSTRGNASLTMAKIVRTF